ncbi:MAG: flagellar motor protein MotB [Alphaproteobacteria bacterium]|nr:MAG: flagellar motor protein MotB [Alphaproteobacteria bacterium]
MAAAANGRRRRHFDAWPGYVDVLSTLLMVVIFVLMVFVIAQFFLSEALTGRDEALERLNRQVAELGELLALERSANADLRLNIAELSAELQGSTEERDELTRRLSIVTQERDQLASSLAGAQSAGASVDEKLEEAYKVIEADRARIQALLGDIAVLESLRDELKRELLASEEEAARQLSEQQEQLAAQQEMSEEAQLRVELLNRQLLALRQQIARLSAALEVSEAKAEEQEVQIVDLGRRLNAALASKVEELARYRSEFFGRLREVLGDREDVQIVGDRFVFQSEVLFESGQADLEEPGKVQLARFADTLLEIAAKIPPEIDWILRVDGHTDRRPISTAQFKSNWELSTARAISVVRFLESQGVPSRRLVAAGFGEYQPLDEGSGEEAWRRNRRIELKLDQR